MKIIVIDLDALALQIIGDFLRDLGHEVFCLSIEEGKLESFDFNDQGVDLVIIDPGIMNREGLDIIREFHNRLSGADIVIMSYTKGVFPFLNAVSHGVYAYLPKPVHFAELELLLTRVQERRQALSRSEFLDPRRNSLLPEKPDQDL